MYANLLCSALQLSLSLVNPSCADIEMHMMILYTDDTGRDSQPIYIVVLEPPFSTSKQPQGANQCPTPDVCTPETLLTGVDSVSPRVLRYRRKGMNALYFCSK